jgi:KaiC/GvpD/RAD55 family RecA-like ATPase
MAKAKIKPSIKVLSKPGKSKVERVKTGIKGFDSLIDGGFPNNALILVSGTCGTGKSLFGMNFLVEGALKGEPGVYVSLEESPEENIRQMKSFDWPVDDLIKQRKLLIIQPTLYNYEALLTKIEDAVNMIGAKRLVLDSLSIIGMYFENVYKVRKSVLELSALLKRLECTTIAIDETEKEEDLSAFHVEEFVVDGLILMYFSRSDGKFLRYIGIRKMRSTNHSHKLHHFEIKSPGGVVVSSKTL